MEVNEAPEKIYIFNNPILDFTKLSVRQSIEDIEYTRTDAFIKKACEWLESVNLNFYQIREGVFSTRLVEDFKDYMKVE